MSIFEALIHFTGGAVGGTAGTAFTCPLEVFSFKITRNILGYKNSNAKFARIFNLPTIERGCNKGSEETFN